MKWISVQERKPEIWGQLVYVINYPYSVNCYIAMYYPGKDDAFVQYDLNLRNHPPIVVSHWCPLPDYGDLKKAEKKD